MLPVLQVVHVTDMHVKHISASPDHKLHAMQRTFARLAQTTIEAFDLFDWNEGTQGHFPHAPESFTRFLENWRKQDGRWYGKSGEDAAQTWLVDSGDLTAIGDAASLREGSGYLNRWRSTLGDCELRTLYGNHDAWPEVLPAHAILGWMPDEIEAQRAKVRAKPEWRPETWASNPLSIAIPETQAHGGSRIELYALDSVCWGPIMNTLAVGEITAGDLEKLRERLRARIRGDIARHFRILALHHPLAFPYARRESHALSVFPAMRLLRAAGIVRELRNDRDDPPRLGPLAHLFLSGHTHLSYPAGEIPVGIMGNQGWLSSRQLQLVGGPLMLNTSRRAANQLARSAAMQAKRGKPKFSDAAVDWTNCQAQILRFYSYPEQYGRLTMIRTPVASVDGSNYVALAPSKVEMSY